MCTASKLSFHLPCGVEPVANNLVLSSNMASLVEDNAQDVESFSVDKLVEYLRYG